MIEHVRREFSRDGYPQQAPMREMFSIAPSSSD
jgi:hypothetical protein